MSLYYDAASILSSKDLKGSLKSRIYSKDASLRSKPAQIYALVSETAKYDTFLKEVIDNADILRLEPKLDPLLSLLLIHDHFFAKKGIAEGGSRSLTNVIDKHKTRLQAEFTRARIKHGCATVEALKVKVQESKGGNFGRVSPRWARVNTLVTSLDTFLRDRIKSHQQVDSIEKVVNTVGKNTRIVHVDQHIPNLLAFPPDEDLTKTLAYKNGEIILQDKASCFPAYLLMEPANVRASEVGDALDGCAAPGNKTTHLAAIISDINNSNENSRSSKVLACERDAIRSKILEKMISQAGANDTVTVLAKQDFLALDSKDRRFRNVTHMLLDPSCSGSGILGREDIPQLALPEDRRPAKYKSTSKTNTDDSGENTNKIGTSKKRKRENPTNGNTEDSTHPSKDIEEETNTDLDINEEAEPIKIGNDKSRLEKLSNLQSKIVEHAFSFPAARRITYSTCSIHIDENERVVVRVLRSRVARERGWRVLTRDEQVGGMKRWEHRGVEMQETEGYQGQVCTEVEREACIRCTPGDGEGTMGFFVCGFVRDDSHVEKTSESGNDPEQSVEDEMVDEESWEGFDDS